jgi:hypothetical protein
MKEKGIQQQFSPGAKMEFAVTQPWWQEHQQRLEELTRALARGVVRWPAEECFAVNRAFASLVVPRIRSMVQANSRHKEQLKGIAQAMEDSRANRTMFQKQFLVLESDSTAASLCKQLKFLGLSAHAVANAAALHLVCPSNSVGLMGLSPNEFLSDIDRRDMNWGERRLQIDLPDAIEDPSPGFLSDLMSRDSHVGKAKFDVMNFLEKSHLADPSKFKDAQELLRRYTEAISHSLSSSSGSPAYLSPTARGASAVLVREQFRFTLPVLAKGFGGDAGFGEWPLLRESLAKIQDAARPAAPSA